MLALTLSGKFSGPAENASLVAEAPPAVTSRLAAGTTLLRLHDWPLRQVLQ